MKKPIIPAPMPVPDRVIRSRRRSIALVVANGEFIIRAPYRAPLRHIERLIRVNRDWIRAKLAVSHPRTPAPPPSALKAYREQARAVIAERVGHFSTIMGLDFTSIRITSARTRWGSCNHRQRSLNFSWRLIRAPHAVLDYVVVHELAHLAHPNHSPAYWRLVGEIMPDYQRLRRSLRDHGHTL